MRLYLDDDSASALLAGLLRAVGHEVELPTDVGLAGEDDVVHLTHAIQVDRLLLSHNHDDFLNLHNLVVAVHGQHPGILIVRNDNDPRRDLRASGIVRALAKLEASGTPLADGFHILNHSR